MATFEICSHKSEIVFGGKCLVFNSNFWKNPNRYNDIFEKDMKQKAITSLFMKYQKEYHGRRPVTKRGP